jgi:hypothetical protein
MKKKHFTQIIIIVVVISMLAAVGAFHASAPINSHSIEVADRGNGGTDAEALQGLSSTEWSSMQDQMRAAQYQFTKQVSDGVWAYRAPNRAHDLSLSFNRDGLHAVRYNMEGEVLWDFGLSLSSYGEQNFPAAIAEDSLSASRERVEYQWSQDVVEWYLNSPEGVEHGLTLAAPPEGAHDSTVKLSFALRGSLTPELDSSAQTMHLKDTSGRSALLYDKLAVYDADNRSLPAHFSLDDGKTLHITINTSRAVYPLSVDPIIYDQAVKLTPSYIEDEAHFGRSVAISGDTIVVGVPDENRAWSDRGAAYVFERDKGGSNQWGEVKKITASDSGDDDHFGRSVAISGDRIVVGAYMEDGVGGTNRGAAYLYWRDEGGADNWGQVKKLIANDTENYDFFGWSVAISGWIVVVGAKWENGAGTKRGAAYVFGRNYGGADNWGQMKKLKASNPEDNDEFGSSVAISGDIIVVGASLEDGYGSDRGAAYVFYRDEGGDRNWGQVKKLIASTPEDGDEFGWSVAISGDTIVGGAPYEDCQGTDHGAIYVYNRNEDGADNWGQVKRRAASDTKDYDNYGKSVSISGDTIVVGTPFADGTIISCGAAYVLERNEGGIDNWGQVNKLIASDPGLFDQFGESAAIDVDTVIIGAFEEDGEGSKRGAAYVYELPFYIYIPLVVYEN